MVSIATVYKLWEMIPTDLLKTASFVFNSSDWPWLAVFGENIHLLKNVFTINDMAQIRPVNNISYFTDYITGQSDSRYIRYSVVYSS